MHVIPIVMEDFLIIILSIPLIDKSLKMNLHWVYNLLLSTQNLGTFSYILREIT